MKTCYFFRSLAPTLDRLTKREAAIAKMEIQRVHMILFFTIFTHVYYMVYIICFKLFNNQVGSFYFDNETRFYCTCDFLHSFLCV